MALAGGVIVRLRRRRASRSCTTSASTCPRCRAPAGILLLLVALELLTGETDDPSRQVTSNVALVPIGTPLLAGPGAIVATMLFVQRADGAGGYVAIAAGHRARAGRRSG